MDTLLRYSNEEYSQFTPNYTLFHWHLDTEIREKAMKEIQKAIRAFKKKGTIDY